MANKKSIIPYEYSDYVLEKYFRETGKNQGWLPENKKRIGVAVSGGGDSIALLWLCKKFYNGEVLAIHINHGIRGHESDLDMNYTHNFALALDVGIIAKKFRVPAERTKGESLEAAARRVRLREICDIARVARLDAIFLGHNKDDLAETVLFNILRGTGIRGSVGITESSVIDGVKFFRPLLGLRRKFLRDILRVRGIKWREDSSNNDSRYTRNFLRLKLLPLIEKKINSAAIEHLANFGADMRKIRDIEDSQGRELLENCMDNNFPALILIRKKVRELDEDSCTLIIREIGRSLNLKTLSRGRCNELANLFKSQRNFIFQWCRNFNVNAHDGKIYFDDTREKNS